MKVFISGVAGFIGSHLADAFLSRRDTVIGNDSLIGGERENVPQGVDFHEIDCNDLVALQLLMQGVDVVYHCAATAHVGLSVFSPHANAMNGYAASAAMMSAACAAGVYRFVFLSSADRYGNGPLPFEEEMRPAPQDPYAIGKVAAEDLLRVLGAAHGMEWTIAVPHAVIGPRQRYCDPHRNVAAIMTNLMLQGRQPTIYGDGGQTRSFTFISDCVAPLFRMADDPKAAGEIFNIGPDRESTTVLDLARRIAQLLNFDLHPTFQPPRPLEVRDVTCSADKARRLLGYAPAVSLNEGLAEMVGWIRARGPRPFEYRLGVEIENTRTPRVWTEKQF